MRCVTDLTLLQNKLSVEKAKQALESEFNELQIELKTLGQSKSDSEHRRKKAESQVQELQVKYGDCERQRQEAVEKISKLQVGGASQTVLKVIPRGCQVRRSVILLFSQSWKTSTAS